MVNWWIVSWLQCLALAKLAPLANKQQACQQGPDNRCIFCIFLLIINNPHINNNCDDTCIIHLSSWYVTAGVYWILWDWFWRCPGHFYAIFIGPRSDHSLRVSFTYWLTTSVFLKLFYVNVGVYWISWFWCGRCPGYVYMLFFYIFKTTLCEGRSA